MIEVVKVVPFEEFRVISSLWPKTGWATKHSYDCPPGGSECLI